MLGVIPAHEFIRFIQLEQQFSQFNLPHLQAVEAAAASALSTPFPESPDHPRPVFLKGLKNTRSRSPLIAMSFGIRIRSMQRNLTGAGNNFLFLLHMATIFVPRRGSDRLSLALVDRNVRALIWRSKAHVKDM